MVSKTGHNRAIKAAVPKVFVFSCLVGGLAFFCQSACCQTAQFFQISGPTASRVLSFDTTGTMIWSNVSAGTYTVQTCSSLAGGSNWVTYVQIPANQGVNTNQIVCFDPPPGMAFIPAGVFTMGDTLDGEDDSIPTNIYVSAFYMDTNLVSYSLWQSVYYWATNNGYGFNDVGACKATNHPVQTVNWFDCVKWCNARSQQAGLVPVYYTDAAMTQVYTNGDLDYSNSVHYTNSPFVNWAANGWRLPTEAEWEKAARGGLSGQRFPWGLTISEAQANYDSDWYYGDAPYYSFDVNSYQGYNTNFDIGTLPYTSPVGHFAANGYGLFDMVGNVNEWCWDWYGNTFGLPTTNNPTGPAWGHSFPPFPAGDGGLRVIRGGSWGTDAYTVRCAYRSHDFPNDTGNIPVEGPVIGFRCVRGY